MAPEANCPVHGQPPIFYCHDCRHWVCAMCVTQHSADKHTLVHLLDYSSTVLPEDYSGIFENLKEIREKQSTQYVKAKTEIVGLEEPLTVLSAELLGLRAKVENLLIKIKTIKLIENAFPSEEKLGQIKGQTVASIKSAVTRRDLSTLSRMVKKADEMRVLLDTGLWEKLLPGVGALTGIVTRGMEVKKLDAVTEDVNRMLGRIMVFGRGFAVPVAKELFCGMSQTYSSLLVYSILKKDFKLIPVMSSHPAVTQVGSRVFLCGGQSYDKTTFEYVDATETLEPRADLKFGRYSHYFLAVSTDALAIIGGQTHHGVDKSCEKYDITSDAWTKMPSLNIPRANCAAALFGGQFLYVFGGYGQGETKGIEVLDLENDKSGWIKLSIKKGFGLNEQQSMGAIQINENEIMLGRNSQVFRYNVTEQKMVKGDNFPEYAEFNSSWYTPIGGKIYAMGNSGTVFAYSIKKAKWTIRAKYQDQDGE